MLSRWKGLLFFLSSALMFIVVFYFAQHRQISSDIEKQLSQVVTRVALDINSLPLADPFFSYSGSPHVVDAYIEKINALLIEQSSRVRLRTISISNIKASESMSVKALADAHRTIYVAFETDRGHVKSAYILPIIMALLNLAFFHWVYTRLKTAQKSKPVAQSKISEPKLLIIDLYNKTVMLNCAKQDAVKLANKPLCFYLALVEYCESKPDQVLNQNKNVPDELVEIADKYFHRLITLGHTIRKRPNFSSSLEKTLSEIRAALDEIMMEHAELKVKYYPPKAHGEGSRSKLHSYGLSQVKLSDIEIIGK